MATSNLPVQAQPAVPVAPGETSSSAIAAREKAAVEARFLVAMNRPRDFETARRRLLDSCRRPAFAAVARYSKPVGRERIYGLSIRFAEEARVLWGNIDVTALLVFDDDERRIYRVQGTDLETNATDGVDVMVEKFVERRQVKPGMEVISSRTNSTGEKVYRIRATEDDLTVKVNAQISKTRRNVILTLLPADVKEDAERTMIETLQNEDAKDPTAARRAVLDAFWKLGVTPAQISDLLEHPIEQTNPAELTLLRSYYTALKEGEATWHEITDAHGGARASKAGDAAPANATGAEALKEKLGAKKDTAKCPLCLLTNGEHRPDCPSGPKPSAMPKAVAADDDLEADDQATLLEDEKRKGGKR